MSKHEDEPKHEDKKKADDERKQTSNGKVDRVPPEGPGGKHTKK